MKSLISVAFLTITTAQAQTLPTKSLYIVNDTNTNISFKLGNDTSHWMSFPLESTKTKIYRCSQNCSAETSIYFQISTTGAKTFTYKLLYGSRYVIRWDIDNSSYNIYRVNM